MIILKDKPTNRIYAKLDNKLREVKEYYLITNFTPDRLDFIKLTIAFLKLKDSTVITKAYNRDGAKLDGYHGVYIEKEKYESTQCIMSKFLNVLNEIDRQYNEMQSFYGKEYT